MCNLQEITKFCPLSLCHFTLCAKLHNPSHWFLLGDVIFEMLQYDRSALCVWLENSLKVCCLYLQKGCPKPMITENQLMCCLINRVFGTLFIAMHTSIVPS